jgi:hypothetical protein
MSNHSQSSTSITNMSNHRSYSTDAIHHMPSFRRSPRPAAHYPGLDEVGRVSSCRALLDSQGKLPAATEHTIRPFPVEIEIAPGVAKTLKGSQETQDAWNEGLCGEAVCFVCEARLAVAPGCDSVICPLCRSVSPILTESAATKSNDDSCSSFDFGDAVGLGILIDP